jgi:ABC-2 type transport system ATP-binding protein
MNVIEVDGLTKRYGRHLALDGVSFSVEEGEIFGILGPNGAGKTTAVESIVGMRKPDAGSIRVLGFDPLRQRDEVRRLVGIQLQSSQQPDRMRVWEALSLYASFYDEPADWEQLIADLGLTAKRDTPYRKLSGGQKQRVSIALALVGGPRVAVLDELTTGLDPQARRETWRLIEETRDRGVTVILVTHLMEEAERLCDRLALIDAGRLVAIDTPAGIVAQTAPDQRLSFRPSASLDDARLLALDEVTAVTRKGETIVVTGRGNVVHAVTALLARDHIVAQDLRIEQATLDDAFIALTGRRLDA